MASVRQGAGNLSGGAMFTLFRYGLLPVVLYCAVIIAAGIDTYWSNGVQKATWRQTVVTVTQSQDPGEAFTEFRGTPNTFPDPRGTVKYVIDGEPYTWEGRGREIGVTVMNPGDKIKIYYNPKDPREISTLVLLGAFTGNIILAVAFAFLAFYFWFFWLRRFLRRSGTDDIERSRSTAGDQRLAAINNRPTGKSFDQGRGATFGKR